MKIKKVITILTVFAMLASFGAGEYRGKLDEAMKLAMKLDKEGRDDEAIRQLVCVVPQDVNSEALKDTDMAKAALAMAKLYLKKIYSDAGKSKDMLKVKFTDSIMKASVCNDSAIKKNVQEVIDAFGRKDYESLRDELERKVEVEARIRDERVKRGLNSREAALKRDRNEFEEKKAQAETALADREKTLEAKEESLAKRERGLVAREEKLKKDREAKLTSNENGQGASDARLNELRSRLVEISSLLEKKDDEIKSYQRRISTLNDKLKEDHSDDKEHYEKNPLAGMCRGVATVAFSPMNLLRAPVQLHHELKKEQYNVEKEPGNYVFYQLFLNPFCMVGDSFIVLHDVCAGTADLLTFGWFGNEWYKSGRTPWFWQRSNKDIGITK